MFLLSLISLSSCIFIPSCFHVITEDQFLYIKYSNHFHFIDVINFYDFFLSANCCAVIVPIENLWETSRIVKNEKKINIALIKYCYLLWFHSHELFNVNWLNYLISYEQSNILLIINIYSMTQKLIDMSRLEN